ncbi:hypothetical protein B0H19DRAFT_1277172 [Mycena capillaripes]|nr:hypothetical protein B0H19DRAFT_1277172 [Mycena capillaripes]
MMNSNISRVEPDPGASACQLHAWSILPNELKPSDEPRRCEHGASHHFLIILEEHRIASGTYSPGDLVVFAVCGKCDRGYYTLTSPSPRHRHAFVAGLALYDKEQASLANTTNEEEQDTISSRTRSQTKATEGEPSTPTKGATKVAASQAKGKGRQTDEMPHKANVSVGQCAAPVTPPRKKVRMECSNVSPAVRGEHEHVTQAKPQDIEVCLFYQAYTAPICITDQVWDVERFQFTQHKVYDFSNVIPTLGRPTVYLCYSPHLGDFKDVNGSRVFGTTNISESGKMVIYRARELTDEQCPGLAKLKTEVHMLSNCGSADFPSFPQAGPSTGRKGPLKRVREDDT